jgi:hypothetical protein
MTLQALLLIRFMSLPGLGRVAIIIIIRVLRAIMGLGRPAHRDRNLEEKDTPPDEKQITLASLFRSDSVAARLANHLHYTDITSISLASKAMREAVFASTKKGSHSERVELLAVNSCDADRKEQCWACASIVCQASHPPHPH